MLSPESLTDFKRRYYQVFGKEISDEYALELGMRLVRLVKVVYGDNVPKKWQPKNKNMSIDNKKKKN